MVFALSKPLPYIFSCDQLRGCFRNMMSMVKQFVFPNDSLIAPNLYE